MGRTDPLDRLAPLIEEFVLEGDAALRERRLLRVLVDQGLARGVGFWREARSGWTRIGSHGAERGLPNAGQVEAVAEGRLDGNLPPEGCVLLAGSAPARCALASVGLARDEELQDLLEALLVLHLSLEGSRPGAADGLVDSLLAPFGTGEDAPGLPHLPSAETASLFALLEEAREELEEPEADAD